MQADRVRRDNGICGQRQSPNVEDPCPLNANWHGKFYKTSGSVYMRGVGKSRPLFSTTRQYGYDNKIQIEANCPVSGLSSVKITECPRVLLFRTPERWPKLGALTRISREQVRGQSLYRCHSPAPSYVCMSRQACTLYSSADPELIRAAAPSPSRLTLGLSVC